MSTMNQPNVKRTTLMLRQIPTFAYTMQNILTSLVAMMSSTASFLFTLCVVLPLSVLRMFMPRKMVMQLGPNNQMNKNKVVLIVGADKDVGLSVLRQYKDDPDVVIIAACRTQEIAHKTVTDLGNTRCRLQGAHLDLSASRKALSEAVRNIDKEFGPITHFYEVSGISTQVMEATRKDPTGWGLDVTTEIIKANVSGTVISVLVMYELMQSRGYGKICVVGSVANLCSPSNMMVHVATKSFINNFSSSLRVIAAPYGVDVVTVQPGFVDTRLTKLIRAQGLPVNGWEIDRPDRMAKIMKNAVENGGVGIVAWPPRQGVVMNGLKAVNPICEELGKWMSMKTIDVPAVEK